MPKNMIKSAIEKHLGGRLNKALALPKEYGDTKAIEFLAQAVKEFLDERGFDYKQRYNAFYEINRKILPDFHINDIGRYILEDKDFLSYFERFSASNWKSFERRWNFGQFLRLLTNVEGDLAECGVFEGANAFQLCIFAEKHSREVHLFDSYEGLSAPAESDGEYWKKGDLSASESLVHQNLSQFKCFKTFKGWIPDAFPQVADKRYSFLHIDVDLEQPTYDSIAFFYPRMPTGAIILLDDHGYDTCPGARKAVLDFMADKPEPVLDLSTGQGLIIKQ
ncbi:MAG: hypothetical protein C0457_16480 [Polymorphum sp.]|nr:hypothetical protein [Polymorphum sp.]